MNSLDSYALTDVSYRIPYNPISNEIDQVLLKYDHAAEILRTLYCLLKSKQKKASLTFICRKAGIPSKGYLALVMNGQRRLHVKYWEGIFRAFKLSDLQQEILRAFFEKDQLICEHSQALHFRQILTLREKIRRQG